jgi:hypothetical protein
MFKFFFFIIQWVVLKNTEGVEKLQWVLRLPSKPSKTIKARHEGPAHS